MNTRDLPRLALTLGDPNGIGPETVLKALHAGPEWQPRVAVFGPPEVWRDTAAALGLQALLPHIELRPAGRLPAGAHRPGQISGAAGLSTVESASAALQACQAGEFAAVVAAPHHETAIRQAGIAFSGYPSLVAQVCGLAADDVFLMLVGGGLRIVHATLHDSVGVALARITPRLVERAALAGLRGCALLGVARPRLGLFGVNPHASEGGLFGHEDAECVLPAALALRAAGHDVIGPLGADMLMTRHAHDPLDGYVAMFHDQGHIPIKLLAPHSASALSIGADVLLASVGHGPALDIAGRGVARPDALLATLALLAAMPAR